METHNTMQGDASTTPAAHRGAEAVTGHHDPVSLVST